jgi:hypothetical protein
MAYSRDGEWFKGQLELHKKAYELFMDEVLCRIERQRC